MGRRTTRRRRRLRRRRARSKFFASDSAGVHEPSRRPRGEVPAWFVWAASSPNRARGAGGRRAPRVAGRRPQSGQSQAYGAVSREPAKLVHGYLLSPRFGYRLAAPNEPKQLTLFEPGLLDVQEGCAAIRLCYHLQGSQPASVQIARARISCNVLLLEQHISKLAKPS